MENYSDAIFCRSRYLTLLSFKSLSRRPWRTVTTGFSFFVLTLQQHSVTLVDRTTSTVLVCMSQENCCFGGVFVIGRKRELSTVSPSWDLSFERLNYFYATWKDLMSFLSNRFKRIFLPATLEFRPLILWMFRIASLPTWLHKTDLEVESSRVKFHKNVENRLRIKFSLKTASLMRVQEFYNDALLCGFENLCVSSFFRCWCNADRFTRKSFFDWYHLISCWNLSRDKITNKWLQA